MASKRILWIIASLCLASCSSHQIPAATMSFNKGLEVAGNQQLLLNAVRASLHQPLYFSDVTGLHWNGGPLDGSSLGATLPLTHTDANPFQLSPTLTYKESVTLDAVSLNNEDFFKGLLSPVSLQMMQYFLDYGWEKELIYYTFFREIDLTDDQLAAIKRYVIEEINQSTNHLESSDHHLPWRPECRGHISPGTDYKTLANCFYLGNLASDLPWNGAGHTQECDLDLTHEQGSPSHRFINSPRNICRFARFQFLIAELKVLRLHARAIKADVSEAGGKEKSDDAADKKAPSYGVGFKDYGLGLPCSQDEFQRLYQLTKLDDIAAFFKQITEILATREELKGNGKAIKADERMNAANAIAERIRRADLKARTETLHELHGQIETVGKTIDSLADQLKPNDPLILNLCGIFKELKGDEKVKGPSRCKAVAFANTGFAKALSARDSALPVVATRHIPADGGIGLVTGCGEAQADIAPGFVVRSPEAMIFYLGEMISSNNPKHSDWAGHSPFVPYIDAASTGLKPYYIPVFMVTKEGGPKDRTLVSVHYGDADYAIPKIVPGSERENWESIHSLSLVSQILALYKKGAALPETPTVRVLGVK